MKNIKKLFLIVLAMPMSIFYGIETVEKQNRVYNKTDKIMKLNFYKNGGHLGKIFIGFATIAPHTGKVGQSVDMHSLTSDNMVLSYEKLKSSLKSPDVTDLRDYQISIENNQLVFRQLDTILGIPTGSHENRDKYSDSKPEVVETPQEKLDRLQKENTQLQADNVTRQEHMDKLSHDIKRLRKQGKVGPMNSRKDERAKEDDKIKSNTKKIADNVAEIAKIKAANPKLIDKKHDEITIQITKLTPDQVANLTDDQFKSLPIAQIKALSVEQIYALPTERVKIMTNEQIKALSQAQLNAQMRRGGKNGKNGYNTLQQVINNVRS